MQLLCSDIHNDHSEGETSICETAAEELCREARKGDFDEVRHLVRLYSTSVNSKDKHGRSALHWVCLSGNLGIVEWLIRQGRAKVNAKDAKGMAPLHLACQRGHPKVVQFLVSEARSDVNLRDNLGWAPLHYACQQKCSLDIVKFLVREAHADTSTTDDRGRKPLHIAIKGKNNEAVNFLKSYKPGLLRLFSESHRRRLDSLSSVQEFHQDLIENISSLSEFKIYYTYLKISDRQGILCRTRVRELLLAALEKILPECSNTRVAFELILDRCEVDGLLGTQDCLTLSQHLGDTVLDSKRSAFDMKQAIQSGCRENKGRGADGKVDDILKNVETILDISKHTNADERPESRYKMRSKAGICAVKAYLGAVSLALLTTGTGSGDQVVFGDVMDRLVDFGSIVSEKAVATGNKTNVALKRGTELATKALDDRDAFSGMLIGASGPNTIKEELMREISEGSVLVVVAFVAGIVNSTRIFAGVVVEDSSAARAPGKYPAPGLIKYFELLSRIKTCFTERREVGVWLAVYLVIYLRFCGAL